MASPARVVICLVAGLVAALFVGPSAAAPVESPVAPAQQGLRIGFVADAQETGERPALRAALADLDRWGARQLLYGGDTSYGYEDAPRDWRDAMRPFEGRTLFVYGNHDKGDGYARYQPRAFEDDTWWVWEGEGLVMVGLDTNSPLHEGSPQRAWFEETLRAHTDDVVVVAMHISWWAPNVYHKAHLGFPGRAEDMDALARDHRVDLVLGGHEHYYARWDRDGRAYVVNGAVEAHTRDVPSEVEREAESATSSRTWMRLEVVECGVAGWTLTRSAGVVDAFFVPLEGASGGVRDGEAYCDAAGPRDGAGGAAAPPSPAGPGDAVGAPVGGRPVEEGPGEEEDEETEPLLPRLLLGGALMGGIGSATWLARRRRR